MGSDEECRGAVAVRLRRRSLTGICHANNLHYADKCVIRGDDVMIRKYESNFGPQSRLRFELLAVHAPLKESGVSGGTLRQSSWPTTHSTSGAGVDASPVPHEDNFMVGPACAPTPLTTDSVGCMWQVWPPQNSPAGRARILRYDLLPPT
eukprot:1244745-Pleurochrysis_carterae.AAC.1